MALPTLPAVLGQSVATGGSLAPASPSNYNPSYGGIPQVPSPGAAASSALSSNLGNLGDIYRLAGSVDTFSNQQAKAALQANLPNYDALTSQASGIIGEELSGQVPHDVINQLIQQAAERGILTGNDNYLRSLGLTSLGQIAKGQQDLTAAVARTPVGRPLDPSAFLTTPAQWEEAQYQANLLASAPNPMMAANLAYGAAKRGLNAGLGSVGGVPGIALPQTSWSSSGGGGPMTVSMNATPQGDTTDYSNPSAQAFANWNAFMSQIPSGNTTASGGSGGPEDYYG